MAYQGKLNPNEIFSALWNMIISQEVFADNIKGTYSSLVDQAKVDGSLYGDTKLYYATDVLKSHAWLNDAEAGNLLALDRPSDPEIQAITIDKFRQIRVSVDDYLSKRAWSTEDAFGNFISVVLGWIRDTKRIYDSTTYNAFIGTVESEVETQSIDIDLATATAGLSGREKTEAEAKEIARSLADLFVNMKDISRDYNDYGFLRSYDQQDIKVIWNSKWINKIRKIDLPTIYHSEGLVDKFAEETLPARYFGEVIAEAGTSTGVQRTMVEMDAGDKHLFAGDIIPNGVAYKAGEAYTPDENIVCKVVTKLPPYMSAFEVGTSFFNPRSLTTNHYLTFGRNTLQYLKAYPMLTVHASHE